MPSPKGVIYQLSLPESCQTYIGSNLAYGATGFSRKAGRHIPDAAPLRVKLAAAHIHHLETYVERLEKRNRRLRRELRSARQENKDLEGELQETQQDMEDIEGRLERAEDSNRRAKSEADRYRGWWLSEYHFVKVLLQMLSAYQQEEVKAIAASSHARFYYHSSS